MILRLPLVDVGIAMGLMKQGAMMTVLGTLVTALAWPATLLAAADFIDSKWAIAVDRSFFSLIKKSGKIFLLSSFLFVISRSLGQECWSYSRVAMFVVSFYLDLLNLFFIPGQTKQEGCLLRCY